MIQEEFVILVDENDREVGTMEKMQAHREAKLHRAFSVFIFNRQKEILLQQRALNKYHSPGLWTNTCCSHPRPGENTLTAAQRRLKEEMGFSCDLKELFSFTYKSEFDNGLTEHEFDHVFIGQFDDSFVVNPHEVAATKWEKPEIIAQKIQTTPEQFTTWFRICFMEFYSHFLHEK